MKDINVPCVFSRRGISLADGNKNRAVSQFCCQGDFAKVTS